MEKRRSNVIAGLFWKLFERFGVLGIQFVLQVILARILDPEHYGVLSLMLVFSALATVFIEHGLSAALVQNKDVTEEDYSSVFWITLAVAVTLYLILFAAAPLIGSFYNMPSMVAPFRVLCLMLLPGALNSVQLAIVSRRLAFQIVFRSSMIAVILSGGAGIALAILGAGLWALVAQSLLNTTLICIVMWFTVKWRPKWVINLKRIKVLFAYGWKLLVSGLLDALYQDAQSLVIGKKYNADTLAYYNRGKQFPQFMINAINSAVQSVLLPAMSAEQDNKNTVKTMTRNTVMLSSYIIFPMMAGLAGVATPLVRLLLTDKWLPCVPFLQICCLSFAFYPVYSANLQAIKAMGRSDIFLKLEIIKKAFGLSLLVIAVFCFDTPIAIALTGVVGIPFDILVNAHPNKKLIGYSYAEQLKDIVPSFLTALIMFGGVLALQLLGLPAATTLLLQIPAGVVLYVALSAVFGLEPFRILLRLPKNIRKK